AASSAGATRIIARSAMAASERPAQDELVARACVFLLQFIFVMVAYQLLPDAVELVEGLALVGIEQVGSRQAQRHIATKGLLYEELQVGSVGGSDLLG